MTVETDFKLTLDEAVLAATRAGDLIVWSNLGTYEIRQKQGNHEGAEKERMD